MSPEFVCVCVSVCVARRKRVREIREGSREWKSE